MQTEELDREREWSIRQIETFVKIRPKFIQYAGTLQDILNHAVKSICPLAIVQARPKAVSSFAEKIKRNRAQYTDAVKDMTDLCGARVITQTAEQVQAVCRFIERNFQVHWEDSQDVSTRLRPSEFGYRSVHYIVELQEGAFPTKEMSLKIPKDLYGLKAEIQVRTLLEHAWADFAHDTIYKSEFKVPAKWQRETATLAAMLEQVNSQFARIAQGLNAYASCYGAYMTPGQIDEELDKLDFILEFDPKNQRLAEKMGNLAIAKGDYAKACNVLKNYVSTGNGAIMRLLGIALCRKHPKNSAKYRQGVKYLQQAAEKNDAESFAELGRLHKDSLPLERIRDYYQKAYELSPSNANYFLRFLEYEIISQKNLSSLSLLKSDIKQMVQRFRDQVDVNMNIPRSLYALGKLYLFLGLPYESLNAYCSALFMSKTPDCRNILRDEIDSFEKMKDIGNDLAGYDWVYRLLLLGNAVRFLSKESKNKLAKVASKIPWRWKTPVVLMAGGCDSSFNGKIQEYSLILKKAFKPFNGSIVSGGSYSGISRLAGNIRQDIGKDILCVGYVPQRMKSNIDKKATRYDHMCRTQGAHFSLLEPLQAWTDLVVAGVDLNDIKLLGINGGQIAAAEFRIALCLGATVGIIKDSGREADELFEDKDWQSASNLLNIPKDTMTLQMFVNPLAPPLSNKEIRETLALSIHEEYRKKNIEKLIEEHTELADWKNIRSFLMDSNRQQADHIMEKLRLIGCVAEPVKGRESAIMTFTKDEIELLAELEHGRWNMERLKDGWCWGKEKDVQKKISPYIISWSALPENIKDYDRETIRKIPFYLAKIGLEVCRDTRSRHAR